MTQDEGPTTSALAAIERSLTMAESRLAELQAEVAALRRARRALLGPANDGLAPAGPPRQHVAQHHVASVRDYLEAQGSARQADIGKELGINSGLVSLAL